MGVWGCQTHLLNIDSSFQMTGGVQALDTGSEMEGRDPGVIHRYVCVGNVVPWWEFPTLSSCPHYPQKQARRSKGETYGEIQGETLLWKLAWVWEFQLYLLNKEILSRLGYQEESESGPLMASKWST